MSNWKDKVMSNKEVVALLEKSCYPSPKYWDEIDLVRKAQADISFKAGQEEVMKWGDVVCMEHGMRKQRRCDTCWQAKLKELGI